MKERTTILWHMKSEKLSSIMWIIGIRQRLQQKGDLPARLYLQDVYGDRCHRLQDHQLRNDDHGRAGV